MKRSEFIPLFLTTVELFYTAFQQTEFSVQFPFITLFEADRSPHSPQSAGKHGSEICEIHCLRLNKHERDFRN